MPTDYSSALRPLSPLPFTTRGTRPSAIYRPLLVGSSRHRLSSFKGQLGRHQSPPPHLITCSSLPPTICIRICCALIETSTETFFSRGCALRDLLSVPACRLLRAWALGKACENSSPSGSTNPRTPIPTVRRRSAGTERARWRLHVWPHLLLLFASPRGPGMAGGRRLHEDATRKTR
jgi:hypothetical protein